MRKAIGIGGFGAIAIALMFMTTTAPIVGAEPVFEAETPLIAGQNINVGYVHVEWDDDYFYVDIVITEEEWTLTDSHVAMSVDKEIDDDCDLSGIPMNKQLKPVPGHFPYEPESEDADGASYIIAFNNIGYGDNIETFMFGYEICMAVHAVVEKGEGENYQEQTAWGKGTPFGKSWAMYFCFEPSAYKHVTIPTGQASVAGTKVYTAGPGYWSVTVSGTDVLAWNHAGYIGWCLEEGQYWNGPIEECTLVTSYDWATLDSIDFNGEPLSHAEWCAINWILNNKGTYSNIEIQEAIWYISGSSGTSGNAKTLGDAALTHTTYAPPVGGWMAIVCVLPNTDNSGYDANSQDIIIEVDP